MTSCSKSEMLQRTNICILNIFCFCACSRRHWIQNCRTQALLNKSPDYLNKNITLCIDQFEQSQYNSGSNRAKATACQHYLTFQSHQRQRSFQGGPIPRTAFSLQMKQQKPHMKTKKWKEVSNEWNSSFKSHRNYHKRISRIDSSDVWAAKVQNTVIDRCK